VRDRHAAAIRRDEKRQAKRAMVKHTRSVLIIAQANEKREAKRLRELRKRLEHGN
jgi:DNA/RNA-binding domain of Phe-tRNA-synthetase-like protein